MRLGLIALCFLIGLAQSWAKQKDVPDYPAKVELFTHTIAGQVYLIAGFSNHKKWHTYWKNPGDAGQAFRFDWSISGEKVEIEELEWPAPRKYIEEGNILAYGYEKNYAFFFRPNKEQLAMMAGKTLTLDAKWLVCKHICLPGEAKLEGKFAQNSFSVAVPSDFKWRRMRLENVLENLPQKIEWPKALKLYLSRSKNKGELVLHYLYSGLKGKNLGNKANLLYPFPIEPFSMKHEHLYTDSESVYGKIPVVWDGEYLEPPVDLPENGQFAQPYKFKFILNNTLEKKYYVIEKEINDFDIADPNLVEKMYDNLTPLDEQKGLKIPKGYRKKYPIFVYFILAFIGGFILNFMPCVLPVISLKLFALISHKNEGRKRIFAHNMFYTLGVCFTFLVLGAVVAILKSAGTSIGWGFQLQSPTFVLIMALVVFLLSLNLFGLFELRTPLGHKLGNINLKDGVVGDFLGGVFATILSTPCSAPFLGTALTFAFMTTTLNIFIIFLFVGLGLSAPFILTAIFPGMIKILPNPGNWMNGFKKFMAIILLLTTAWLGSVYYNLVFQDNIIEKHARALGLNWQTWSPKKMQELKGEWVFIDFTAQWCLTCKVNERLFLHTDRFKEIIEKRKLKLLLADWTKRDETITNFLNQNGLVGVPAYFIQKPNGELINLGETLTFGKIEENLDLK